MPQRFEPHTAILPPAQRELWPRLRGLSQLGFVLYGGTAVALHLGHRVSLDFDFFCAQPLDKTQIRRALPLLSQAAILQDAPDTLAISVAMPSGAVKLSFFGGISFGRVGDPVETADQVLLVASLDDLMATKLKTILDRAEARDYQDIAAMLRHGASLENGLSSFRAMFGGEPATVLRALGWFEDGNLATVGEADRRVLTDARDRVGTLPQVVIMPGTLVA